MVLLSLRDKKIVSMSYSDIAVEVTKVGGVHPTRQAIIRLHKVMQKDKQWYPGKVTNNAKKSRPQHQGYEAEESNRGSKRQEH